MQVASSVDDKLDPLVQLDAKNEALEEELDILSIDVTTAKDAAQRARLHGEQAEAERCHRQAEQSQELRRDLLAKQNLLQQEKLVKLKTKGQSALCCL